MSKADLTGGILASLTTPKPSKANKKQASAPAAPLPSAPSEKSKFWEENDKTKKVVKSLRAPSMGQGRPVKSSTHWDKSRNFVTSATFDMDQYLKVTELAYEHRLSVKETLFRLIEAGIKAVEKKPEMLD